MGTRSRCTSSRSGSVLELILGTAQLVQRYGIMAGEPRPEAATGALLATAEQLGVRTLDTAPAYGDAESVIGRSRTPFMIHTKLPRDEEPATALAASLDRLQRDSVEVIHLHDPDIVLNPNDPRIDAAAALISHGADALGASVYTPEQFAATIADLRITVVQCPINLFDRRIADDQLERAERGGTRVIARSALLQGVLAHPERAVGRVPALDAALAGFANLCRELERSPVEVAMLWVLARPAVSGLVIGAETPSQLEALVAAAGSPSLAIEEVVLLDSLAQPSTGAADPRTWTASPEPQGGQA